jgi:hypothetical protein
MKTPKTRKQTNIDTGCSDDHLYKDWPKPSEAEYNEIVSELIDEIERYTGKINSINELSNKHNEKFTSFLAKMTQKLP